MVGIVAPPLPGEESGMVKSWSGAISAIPSGYVLCDGNNSTPNLTDRFILHADNDSGGTRDVGDTGGAMTHTLTTAELASHNHTVAYDPVSGGSSVAVRGSPQEGTFPTGSTGSGNAHAILNKFHALAFVMKT